MKNNNVLLVILILLVLILIIGGFFYIKNISDKQNEILANISEGNIVNKNTTNNAEENNMNLVAETDKNIDDETEVQVTFNPDKMISTNKFVRYEEDLRDRGTSGINVEVKDGKVFVSTDIEDEGYKLLLGYKLSDGYKAPSPLCSIQYLPNEFSTIYFTIQSGVNN